LFPTELRLGLLGVLIAPRYRQNLAIFGRCLEHGGVGASSVLSQGFESGDVKTGSENEGELRLDHTVHQRERYSTQLLRRSDEIRKTYQRKKEFRNLGDIDVCVHTNHASSACTAICIHEKRIDRRPLGWQI